ncbi:phage tail protein [Orrella dioscoreae]|uniref:Phage tail protein n=1 Tax=Orrella dioscoreae TaxID=1851544 RepID=A0A1C3K3E1_9BURK|nr:phage tail protein [Orrella dioscoreae]SBT25964.1 Phage tail protein [Orrella dioscoreae]SOE50883.1 Phage tail protein [Orrella dioscoreae]
MAADKMMGLGNFVFGLTTASYSELKRRTDWRHASNSRMGARPARQYVGPGEDTITLSGVLLPQIAGKADAMEMLRRMGNTGLGYALVDGAGNVYGAYIIESMDEGQSQFLANGTPQRYEFTLTLQCVDDQADRTEMAELDVPGTQPEAADDWAVA